MLLAKKSVIKITVYKAFRGQKEKMFTKVLETEDCKSY